MSRAAEAAAVEALAQVEDATQDRRLGYLNVISCLANGSIRYSYWIQCIIAQGSHT